MNIKDILHQPGHVARTGVMPDRSPFLSIGKKGQVVEGVISKISDKISISFNGIEVAVPHSAVRGATEGETRKFQIMDVSKDNIVLKEVGNTYSQGSTRALASTKVPDNAGVYSNNNDVKVNAQVAAEDKEAVKNIAILTGEDYASIEKEEGNIENCKEDELERAAQKVKEQKEWKEFYQESNKELCQQLKEGLENIQKQGFLDQKSESQIAQVLREADIPPTLENISRVVSALQMSLVAGDMSDKAKSYIISNGMPPTIENIYHGQYSGSDAYGMSVYDQEIWESLKGQIEDIIDIAGLGMQTATDDAKWLLANDLPVTIDNLRTLDVLRDIKDNTTLDKALVQIVQAMAAGSGAEQALLDTSQFTIARDLINSFNAVNDGDIVTAIKIIANNAISNNAIQYNTGGNDEVQELNLALLKQAGMENENNGTGSTAVIPENITDGMSEQEIQAVIAKKNIAEICLKMTVQSVGVMAEKGINIETAPLENIVKELRDIENAYYMSRYGISAEMADKELGLMQEALQKTSDIANAPASVIGMGIRQMNLISFNELHAAAVSETANKNQFMEIYEKVATEPDKNFGDSIEKAFQRSVPDILQSLGLEDTQANERAVRILGYNSMEITEDNINAVKEYDASLNRIIDNMKPSVVLDIIRNGSNPLEKSVEELDRELAGIASDKGVTQEEKYSRYLWQLERSNSITEQERDGYIGVYRLLNNIEKTDGAAIGAVIQSKREMTLGNLLSAVRSIKGRGIDVEVDNNYGRLEGLVYHSKPITAQIDSGFNPDNNENGSNSGNRYYQGLVSEAIDNITPDSVNEISDGDMEKLLNTSLEKFAEEMKSRSPENKLMREYYDKQAEEVRDMMQNRAEADLYLANMQIPSTVASLGAAIQMVKEGYSPVKDCYGRRNILGEKEKKEFEEAADSMAESLGSEESIKAECEKTRKYMEEILSRSYCAPDITSDELMKLKSLGRGIQLHGMMAGRRSYDIPIVTGDTITNMNVTVLSGQGDKGKVKISVGNAGAESEPGKHINISAEFKISNGAVKGLVVCSNRESYEAVQESSMELKREMKEAGFEVKNISCSLGAVRGGIIDEKINLDDNTSTASLYKAAKITACYLSDIIKNIESQ